MLTRRIVAGTAALALVVPAAAAARPADNQPAASRGASVAKSSGAASGDTKYDLQASPKPASADRFGSLPPEELAATYGKTKIDATRVVSPAASTDDATDGWQIAAVSEGGLLAAVALGSVLLLRARRRVVA
jgi:hypothetical protein